MSMHVVPTPTSLGVISAEECTRGKLDRGSQSRFRVTEERNDGPLFSLISPLPCLDVLAPISNLARCLLQCTQLCTHFSSLIHEMSTGDIFGTCVDTPVPGSINHPESKTSTTFPYIRHQPWVIIDVTGRSLRKDLCIATKAGR